MEMCIINLSSTIRGDIMVTGKVMSDLKINTNVAIRHMLRNLIRAQKLPEICQIANQIRFRAGRLYNDARKEMVDETKQNGR